MYSWFIQKSNLLKKIFGVGAAIRGLQVMIATPREKDSGK